MLLLRLLEFSPFYECVAAFSDRLVHNAHRLKLGEAESIRKTAANLTTKPKQSK